MSDKEKELRKRYEEIKHRYLSMRIERIMQKYGYKKKGYAEKFTKGASYDTMYYRVRNDSDDDQEWKTINGAAVPVGENGELQGEVGRKIEESSEGGEGSESEVGTLENPSATGANPDLPGFTSKNLDKHFGGGGKSDHSKQYPDFTKEQYAQRALELARSPVGGDIEGYRASGGDYIGSIVRYDKGLNDWVRAWPNGIATMFKPDKGTEYFAWIANIEK